MNKSKYVDKMTDLVEDTLQKKGVSDDFTIEDNYEEDGEMSMTLTYDATGHEVTFQLQELYDQKKEADVKVKDQYAEHFKTQVESFVEREVLAERASRAQARNQDAMEEDFDEYEDEDEYEDYDDYDDEEDYEDEEERDEDAFEEVEQSDSSPIVEESSEPSTSAANGPAISSTIAGLFKPLEFVSLNGDGSVKATAIPTTMQGKTPEELANRYKDQIKDLFEDGAIVVHPNKNDLVVFDMGTYSKEEVAEMLPEMMEEGGSDKIVEVESEKEPELP